MKPYAHKTDVPVSRSRGEIDRILCAWDCDAIQWTDDRREGVVQLRFRWTFEGVPYNARIRLALPPDETLYTARERKEPWRQRDISDQVMQQRRNQRWRSLHRVLVLGIKARLNEVAAGLWAAPEVFLPYLEGIDGRTIADVAIPHLRQLGSDNARALLEG